MTACTSPSLQVGFRPLLQTLFLQDDLAQRQVCHELPECAGKFNGPHVWENRRTPRRMLRKVRLLNPLNPGAPRRAYPKQGRSELADYYKVRGGPGMISTARLQRESSEAARCASTGIAPCHSTPFFSALLGQMDTTPVSMRKLFTH